MSEKASYDAVVGEALLTIRELAIDAPDHWVLATASMLQKARQIQEESFKKTKEMLKERISSGRGREMISGQEVLEEAAKHFLDHVWMSSHFLETQTTKP